MFLCGSTFHLAIQIRFTEFIAKQMPLFYNKVINDKINEVRRAAYESIAQLLN